jgi:hypothetical protein
MMHLPRCRGRAASAVAVALLCAAHARARPHYQAVGEASLGYTDNAQAAPSTASDDDPVVARSVFLMLSPGAVVAYASPRQLQRLAYRYEYDLYFDAAASSSSSNRLDYRSFFDLSPRLTLVLGASVTESDRFNTVAFGAPGASAIGAVPTGTGSYLAAGADEGLNIDVGPGWRGWETGYALVDTPIFGTEAPRTIGLGGRLGLERSFFADAVGVEGRADYSIISDSIEPDGTPIGKQRQVVAGGVALWRHDWGRYVTSSADAGALRVQRLNSGKGFWTPTGTAVLAYTTEDGDAQLSYSHTVTTNALLGQTLLIDEVRLRGELPLTKEGELTLASTLAYQRGKLIDEDASLATRVRVILGDISLGWQATKLLELGVRYEHVEQKSGANTPPLPVSFVQNNVLIGATLKFPQDRDMPRPYRAPRRVDRSDEIRDGIAPGAAGPRAPGEGAR